LYALQAAARELLPSHRVASCLRSLAPQAQTVDLCYRPAARFAFFKNLQVCGNVWVCPLCSARVTEQRRKELSFGLAGAFLRYQALMITYTFRHTRADTLISVLEKSKEARRVFKRGDRFKRFKAAYGWLGSVTSTEVTHTQANGWHVHYHEIVLIKRDADVSLIVDLQRGVKKLWLESLRSVGLDGDWEHAVNFELASENVLAYVAKWGHEPLDMSWNITHEAVKGPSKLASTSRKGRTPFQLLNDCLEHGDAQAVDLFKEYAVAFKGKNQLNWSPGLRKLLRLGAEKTDGELALQDVSPSDVLLASLSFEQWRFIASHELRGPLVEVGNSGDPVKVKDWLEQTFAELRLVHVDLRGA
jgi:hypothetical protein